MIYYVQESFKMFEQKATNIKLIIFDVDGVLTDGKIYHSANGDELKAFNVQDGLGIKLLQKANIQTAIITARSSSLVETRAKELNISHLYQGQSDKKIAYNTLLELLQLQPEQVAYVGDDLPDLPLIKLSGLGITVQNGAKDVKKHADWITEKSGGNGAVREIAEAILNAQNHWVQLIAVYI